MKNTNRQTALFCCLLALADYTLARDISALKVGQPNVGIGSEVRLSIELSEGSQCGAVVSFGDGSAQEIKIEANTNGALSHTYQTQGSYQVTVEGKRLWRGLNTTAGCDGAAKVAISVSSEMAVGETADNARTQTRSVATQATEKMAGSPATVDVPRIGVGQQRRVALVIGNAAYQQGQGTLINPVNDARAMSKRLRSLGFDVVMRENLKTREISGVYREFRSKITPGDVALVFYSGHGVQFKGQNYFPAIDAEIVSQEDVPLQSINLDSLLGTMEEAKAGISLVFLDACRDNPFARNFRSSTRGLARVESATGTLIHYATKPGSVASDGTGQNGTYTEALLAQMSEPDVPVEQMLKRVANRVVEQTKGKQEPWFEGGLRGDFYFVFNGSTTIQMTPQGNLTATPARARTTEEIEDAYWDSIKEDRDQAQFEAYLKQYPKGRYRPLAEREIRRLKASPQTAANDGVSPAPTGVIVPVVTQGPDTETQFWTEVKTSGTKEYFDAYLKQYPKGKYVALARVELKKLDDKALADRAKEETDRKAAAERTQQENLRAELQAWDQAKAENSVSAYGGYVERFPTGRYVALAEAAKQKLLREAAEREKVALQQVTDREKQQEIEHWRRAESTTNSASMQSYIDSYPNGRYVTEARTKLASVKQAEVATGGNFVALRKGLTPLGGISAGNNDGSIPPYTGGLTKAPACFRAGVEYCDPFAGERPKFTITSANAAQYADKLPAGALAMLEKYDTFEMPVYVTHRTAAVPNEVSDAVKAEAGSIGYITHVGVVNRIKSTTPFPIPKGGLEAISNHTFRYLSGGFERPYNSFPVRADGSYFKITTTERRVFTQNIDQQQENRLYSLLSWFQAPETLVGTNFLIHEPADMGKTERAAWIYNATQRRVRRAPDLAYDAVNDGTEGLRFTDQFDAYNGAPDRFDWKLVGKREMYVPYNTYKIGEKNVRYSDILRSNHANPDLMRYELHRVWVVEGTLKASSKHSYGKRIFLLDEDSWNVLWEDAYDARGDLWRVGIHGFVQYYDAGVPWTRFNSWHDLTNGAYLMSGLDNELQGTVRFGLRGKADDFTPDALRRAGVGN